MSASIKIKYPNKMDLFACALVFLIFFSLYITTQSTVDSNDKALFDNFIVMILIYSWFIASGIFGLYVLLNIIDSFYRMFVQLNDEILITSDYISIPIRSLKNLFCKNRNMNIRKDEILNIEILDFKSEFLNYKVLLIKINNNSKIKMHLSGIKKEEIEIIVKTFKEYNYAML